MLFLGIYANEQLWHHQKVEQTPNLGNRRSDAVVVSGDVTICGTSLLFNLPLPHVNFTTTVCANHAHQKQQV